MYDKDGSSLSVWNAYRGDGWVKKGQNLAYVLCTRPHNRKVVLLDTSIFQLKLCIFQTKLRIFSGMTLHRRQCEGLQAPDVTAETNRRPQSPAGQELKNSFYTFISTRQ